MTQAHTTIDAVLAKGRFWQRWASLPLNDREAKMLNKLLEGFEGNLTTSKRSIDRSPIWPKRFHHHLLH